MAELDPYSFPIILSALASLVVFYLVGAFITQRLCNCIKSIGVRMSIGCLAIISVFAIAHADTGTGMIFYLLLLAFMVKQNWGRPDFSDAKELGIKGVTAIILFGLGVTLLEAYRSNLIEGAMVFVGNADVSYYSSFAHNLYLLGIESNAENISPEIRGDVYHFGDLWLSGLYSYLLGVLPYYSYSILYRALTIVMISLMTFGWIKEVDGHWLMGILGVGLTMGAVYVIPFQVALPDVSLLEFITCVYPLYGAHAYFIVGVVGLAFSILMFEGKFTIGAIGIMLMTFISSGFILATAGAALLILAGYLIFKVFKLKIEIPSGPEVALIIISGFVGAIYFKLDGRLDEPTMNVLSGEFIYLFIHTIIRLVLSQIFVIPFLVGILYFLNRKSNYWLAVGFQMTIYAGILGSLAFIFPQIQGNSTQISALHFTAMLAPIGIVGLIGLASRKSAPKWLCGLTWVSIVLITIQATRIAVATNWYEVTFQWTHMDSYEEKSSVLIEDWNVLNERFSKVENRIGYFARPSQKALGVHYNAFTYLKGILPGTTFYRMNPLPSDTALSTEMLGYYYRTGLGHFARNNGFNPERTTSAYLEFLQPEAIIVPAGSAYYFPEELALRFPNKTIIESFTIHEK